MRGRDDLIAQRVALANQLRSLLEGFWPGAASIFAAIDSPIALAFIGRYPNPDSASRLGEKRLASFLVQHAYSGRRSAADLLARLRAAPTGLASDTETEARGEIVRALVGVLERLILAIAKLSSRIEQAVAQLPDGRIVMSFPRAGRINAAQILAELGDVRERFPTEDQLAAEAGVCPVTHASGKNAAWSSDGPAIRTCGWLSHVSRTTPAMPAHGPPPSTKKPVSVGASTPMRCVSWPAPGYASSGEPGRTANPTTHLATPVLHASSERNHSSVRLQRLFFNRLSLCKTAAPPIHWTRDASRDTKLGCHDHHPAAIALRPRPSDLRPTRRGARQLPQMCRQSRQWLSDTVGPPIGAVDRNNG